MKINMQVQQTRYGYIPVEVPDDFLKDATKRSRVIQVKKTANEALAKAPETVVWDDVDNEIFPTGNICS